MEYIETKSILLRRGSMKHRKSNYENNIPRYN